MPDAGVGDVVPAVPEPAASAPAAPAAEEPAPAAAEAVAPAGFPTGAVFNGYRFNGVEWLPVEPAPASASAVPTTAPPIAEAPGTMAAEVISPAWPPAGASGPWVPPAPSHALGGQGPVAVDRALAVVVHRTTRIGAWDWWGPARVAGSILGVSGVLAVVLGLAMRPTVAGGGFGSRTTIVYLEWLWASAFGTDLAFHVSFDGDSSLIPNGANVSYGFGLFPLAITIAALAVGVFVFRRVSAAYTSGRDLVLFSLRTALITATPILILSWLVYNDASGLLGALNADSGVTGDLLGGIDPTLSGVVHARVGTTSLGAFLAAVAIVFAVLSLSIVTRDGILTGPWATLREWMIGPVTGIGALAVVLVPAGWIAAVVVKLSGITGVGPLNAHQWLNIIALGIIYGGNIGLWAASLGSLSSFGVTASAGGSGSSTSRGVGWIAGNVSGGAWIALGIAPAALALTAWWIARGARHRPGAQRLRLVTWAVSLLVGVPFLAYLSSIHLGMAVGASGMNASMGMSAGPSRWSSAFLVCLYAMIIAVLVGAFSGAFRGEWFHAAKGRYALATPGGAEPYYPASASAAPYSYQVGDVVNGHRFDGAQWVPLDPEASAAPAVYQVGDVVNGHRFDGAQWVPLDP
ncbi:MAG: hypothetical protein FWD74_05930 [Actinomycetia bacterium]|nr:hypothetical protein [Actinomycetes bacterium]